MSNEIDPFRNSQALADWAADILRTQGIDELQRWRMLEYWLQVELFRAIEAGLAGQWRHVGDYEHPYHTERPRSGSRTKTKWIDLVLSSPTPDRPDSVMWVELKDIGRSKTTLRNNSRGLGHDLAALWAMDPAVTQEIWLDPPGHVMDRGRMPEWSRFGPQINADVQLISQIVICHKALISDDIPGQIEADWLEAFHARVVGAGPSTLLVIRRAETESFHVFSVVGRLGQ